MAITGPGPAFGGSISGLIENPLFMPGCDLRMAPVTIQGGQNNPCGSILGKVTATGKFKLSDASATDGSQIPCAILIEDLANDSDITFSVAIGGLFNETALVYGPGHNPNTVRLPLRDARIYLSAHTYSFA